jgi:hypothetical protein
MQIVEDLHIKGDGSITSKVIATARENPALAGKVRGWSAWFGGA